MVASFIDSAYPTKAAYDAAMQLKPALRADDEAQVKAGFEKLTTLDKFTSIAARRSLGDGRSIPVVGLGLYYTPPGAVTYDIVAAALKHGYRHLDTADFYENEADVGRAVRDSGIPRDEIHITSKVWPGEDGEWVTDGKKVVLDAVEASVKRLGTYTDLYLIHTPFNPEQRINYYLGLEAAQQKGLTKSIGVSNFGVKHLQELIESPLTSVPPAANEVEMHPFLRKDDIVGFCTKRGMAVIAYSPLARAMRFDNPVLARIAKTYGVSPAQVLVRWSMQHGYVPLPKSVRAERIAQNADVFGFELTQADMSELDTLDERLFTEWDEWGKFDPTTMEITAAEANASRGAKVAVAAAEAAQRPVAAMVLLDPVDATIFESETILPALRRTRVPTAICGSGLGGEACAPKGSNYDSFFEALGSSTAAEGAPSAPSPRLLALLRRAGHTQYIDERERMLDVCNAGTESDAAVHEVALSVLAAWLGAFVPGVATAGGADSGGMALRGGWRPSVRASSSPSSPTILGTGRASGSYLMLAQKTSRACAAATAAAAPRSPASSVPLCSGGEQRSAECLSILETVRFGADVQFTIQPESRAGS